MKRIGKGALELLLAATLLCGNALAANDPYVFEEFDLEVTVPEGDYYILTRGMDPDSPTLAGVGLTAQQVDQLMEPGNIYLVALADDISYELNVSVLETELSDYDMFSQKQRGEMAAITEEGLKEQGFTLAGAISWYEGGEAPYMVVEVLPTEESGWSYQYQTVYNGRMIIASAGLSALGEPTDEIREQVRLLAEGIHYTKKLPTAYSLRAALEKSLPWESITDGATVGIWIGILGMTVFLAIRSYRKKYGAKRAAAENDPSQEETTYEPCQ